MLNIIRKFSPPEMPLPIFHDDPEYSRFWNRSLMLFILVFLFALILRIAQFFLLRTSDPSFNHLLDVVDTKNYDYFAQIILAGDFFLRSVPVFFIGPIYAYFLAVIYGVFGHHYVAAHAIQYVLGAASAAIIFLASRFWFSNRVSFFAGLCPALSATLIVYEGYLLPESLIFFLVTIVILFTGLAKQNPNRSGYWLLLGFILGLAAVQRANILLCGFGFLYWIVFGIRDVNIRQRLIAIFFFVTGILLALVPIALHNCIFGGQLTLITSNGPINFYIGNGVEANGTFNPGPIFDQHLREVASGATTWMQLLIRDIMSDPIRWATIMLKKIYLFWSAYDPPDDFNYELYKKFTPITTCGQLPYYLICSLGFVGMVAVRQRYRYLMALYLFSLIYMLSVVAVFVSGRFRLLEIAPMSIFAGVALCKMASWLQTRQWRILTASCASVMALMFLLNIFRPLFPIRMNDYVMLSRYYDSDGNTAGSIATMQEAIKNFETARQGKVTVDEMRVKSLAIGRSELAADYIKAGCWENARAVLKLQFQSGHYDEQMVLMLIQADAKLGEKNEAVGLARQMSNRFPDNPRWQSILQATENLPN